MGGNQWDLGVILGVLGSFWGVQMMGGEEGFNFGVKSPKIGQK